MWLGFSSHYLKGGFAMEPPKEEKTVEAPKGAKKKHFRIVKLEERIAPTKGGNGTNNTCDIIFGCCGHRTTGPS